MLPLADSLAVIGIVVALVALALSVYVYQWSKTDLAEFTRSTEASIQRWSDVTIRIESATTRIEREVESLRRETFSLVRDHYVRATDRDETGAAAREAERAEKLLNHIQTQSTNEIEAVLKRQGIALDVAPQLQSQLSTVFANSLKQTRDATDRAREDTLREEVLRVVRDHEGDELTLATLADLLSSSFSRSEIAGAIEGLRNANLVILKPDELQPDVVIQTRREV